MHLAKTMCMSYVFNLFNCCIKANQPELLDEAFGMLRDQAENATVSKKILFLWFNFYLLIDGCCHELFCYIQICSLIIIDF